MSLQIPVLCVLTTSFLSSKSRRLPAYLKVMPAYLTGISNSVFPEHIWPFILNVLLFLSLHFRRTNTIHTAVQSGGPWAIPEVTVSITHQPMSLVYPWVLLVPFPKHILTQAISSISLYTPSPCPSPVSSYLDSWNSFLTVLQASIWLLTHSLPRSSVDL